VTPPNSTVEMITQRVLSVGRDRKRELLSFMIGRHRWDQVLVFTRTKHGADKLAQALERDGIRTQAIHGNKSQGARTRRSPTSRPAASTCWSRPTSPRAASTSWSFRASSTTTCPTSRGLRAPHRPHRPRGLGRRGDLAVCIDEHNFLRDIERLIKRTLPRETVEGFEPDRHERAQPVFKTQQPRGRAHHGAGTPHAHARKPGAPRGQGRPAGHGKPSQRHADGGARRRTAR
jgi:ATP-dependent RNA helicase RhlE